jgi:hypothetical protein
MFTYQTTVLEINALHSGLHCLFISVSVTPTRSISALEFRNDVKTIDFVIIQQNNLKVVPKGKRI